MCDISNIKNMRGAKIGDATRNILLVKAALQDMDNTLVEIGSEIYGESYKPYYEPIGKSIDALNSQIDQMLLHSININIECGVGTVI